MHHHKRKSLDLDHAEHIGPVGEYYPLLDYSSHPGLQGDCAMSLDYDHSEGFDPVLEEGRLENYVAHREVWFDYATVEVGKVRGGLPGPVVYLAGLRYILWESFHFLRDDIFDPK